MEIRVPVKAVLEKDGSILLKTTNRLNFELVRSLFKKKQEWEQRNNKEYYLQAHLELNYQKRTYKQNRAVWILVTAIFESMEGRKPTEKEKYALYLDLLELYADKVPNRFKKNAVHPVHISDSNSAQGARFIDGLLYHLATECDLEYGTQITVQQIFQQWEEWRGSLEVDPIDYRDIDCTDLMPEAEWRQKHPYSEASGRGGHIVLAHIVSRGSNALGIDKSWNWIALLHEEHKQQHDIGWDAFLQIYPHLRGRVERARRLAGSLELEYKRNAASQGGSASSLAMEALEDKSSHKP